MNQSAAQKMRFLSVKAFGDFVIALTSLERVARSGVDNLSIIAAPHLAPLAEALKPSVVVNFLPSGNPSVPALFDIRKAGAISAVKSGILLRHAVARTRAADTALVLDNGGPRERFLTWPTPVQILPHTRNIYLSYRDFLAAADYSPMLEAKPGNAPRGNIVGIFPGSRIAAKNIAGATVERVIERVGAAGLQPRLMLLDGERPDLEASQLQHTLLPRTFGALVEAIASADRVVSADSLPAHLAERACKDILVVSPRPNRYWLPLSSYRANHWALFDDPTFDDQIDRFLEA